jgi:GTPase involved in cell partitioning and DNA repair
MVKKKAKKKAKKKLTPLEKIKKELGKLEALHDKENVIVENINDIIDEEDNDWDDVSYGGTDPD